MGGRSGGRGGGGGVGDGPGGGLRPGGGGGGEDRGSGRPSSAPRLTNYSNIAKTLVTSEIMFPSDYRKNLVAPARGRQRGVFCPLRPPESGAIWARLLEQNSHSNSRRCGPWQGSSCAPRRRTCHMAAAVETASLGEFRPAVSLPRVGYTAATSCWQQGVSTVN